MVLYNCVKFNENISVFKLQSGHESFNVDAEALAGVCYSSHCTPYRQAKKVVFSFEVNTTNNIHSC